MSRVSAPLLRNTHGTRRRRLHPFIGYHCIGGCVKCWTLVRTLRRIFCAGPRILTQAFACPADEKEEFRTFDSTRLVLSSGEADERSYDAVKGQLVVTSSTRTDVIEKMIQNQNEIRHTSNRTMDLRAGLILVGDHPPPKVSPNLIPFPVGLLVHLLCQHNVDGSLEIIPGGGGGGRAAL